MIKNSKPTCITHNQFEDKAHFDRLDFLLANHKEGKILDIGNLGGLHGEGPSNSSHLNFKKLISDNCTLYGFDLYTPKDPKKYLHQQQGDLENPLPYDTGFFDTIYMGQILEHMKNPGKILKNINNILKDDGVLIMDLPNPYSFQRIIKYLLFKKEDLGDPTHLIFFTPASLKSLLHVCGFELQQLSCKHPRNHRFLPHFFIKGLGSHLLIMAKKA